MKKPFSRSLLLCGSALMGLSMMLSTAKADSQTATATNQPAVTQVTTDPTTTTAATTTTTPATTTASTTTPTTTTTAAATDTAADTTTTTTSAVPVVTNHDQAAKPSETTDWANPADYQGAVPVQILGINDFHGGLELGGKAQIDGNTYQNTGTAARLAAYLNAAEADFKAVNPTGTTFRVEAGDMVGASPANSALLQDESTMHALKAMNIAIGTLGNHEFDEGLPEYLRIVNGGEPTKQYNEAEMAYPHEASGISIITANVIDKKTGQVPEGLQPYLIKEIHTADNQVVKVGFIGIETTSLPILTLYDNYKDYDILDEAETIAKYSKILRNQGVNAIVVLAHTAVESSDGETKGDAVDILQKVYQIDPNNSVDIYLAAHSHQYANAKVGQTNIVQAIYTGKAYDDIIGYIDPTTNDFIGDSVVAHVFPVLSEADDPATVADPTVLAIVDDANQRVATIINKKIGEAAEAKTITGRLYNTASMENGAGEVVVDGQLYEARKAGFDADFAMTNGGGVRADIVVGADKSITWGAAQAVQPFGNILRVVSMTGAQIRETLNQQYDEDQKFYLQISGLKYTYTDQDDDNQPYKVVNMYKSDGTPIEDDQTYKVVINDFLAGGGDSFTAFTKATLVGIVGQDTESFIDYITDMTAQGTPIAMPALDRKIYLTNEQVAEQENQGGTDQTGKDDQTTAPEGDGQSGDATKDDQSDGKKSGDQGQDDQGQDGQSGSGDQGTGATTPTANQAKAGDQSAPAATSKQDSKQATLPQTGDQHQSGWQALGLALLGFLGLTAAGVRKQEK